MSLPTKVFVIDDDQTFTFLTKKVIRATSHNTIIQEFSDGQEAIEFLKGITAHQDQLPDIIFLDLNMPVMDGWEFLEEYEQLQHQISKPVKLYIVSSSISPHDIERSKSFTAVTDFLIKPLMKGKFTEIVENL